MPATRKKVAPTTGSTLPSRKTLPPFEALRAFDAVARLGGVRKAATGLDRDHAVISRHIRSIEAWTGSILVERTPTGVVLTDEGKKYHGEIAAAIDMIANATADLMKTNEQQALNIWCMPAFAFHWLTGRLGALEKAHPGTMVEVRPTDTSPDLIAQEADVDIRLLPQYGNRVQIPKGVKSAEITTLPVICVASPEYLESKPAIKSPADLLDHQLLHEDDHESWFDWLDAYGVAPEEELTGPLLWQGHLTLDAARHGRGIALSNRVVAASDLETGKLIDVTTLSDAFDDNKTLGSYMLLARSDRWDMPSLRRFRSWLLSTIAKET